tara:strand:- start:6327 stop:8078 length:1752 start_codon:yes stop_codon:yes gene_type:complete
MATSRRPRSNPFDANLQEVIKLEKERAVAAAVAPLEQQIGQQTVVIDTMGQKLREQNELLVKHMSMPFGYATVLTAQDEPNPDLFKRDALIRRVGLTNYQRGKIVGDQVVDGKALCRFKESEEDEILEIGIGCQPQIRLLEPADDGTSVTILVGDKPFQIGGYPEMELKPGDTVLITTDNQKPPTIIAKTQAVMPGTVANVTDVFKNGVAEVQGPGGAAKAVIAPEGIKSGDRVVLDHQNMVIIDVLPPVGNSLFKIADDLSVSWDDIGGLDDAKLELQQAIEWPITKKAVFAHYGTPIPKGILLYGPPGCGKTLCGKACFTSLAQLHGAEVKETGFIYCKGPEILDKFVGNSEAAIRDLFARGEDHYKKHGYPALLFIDEADAILRKRGTDAGCSGILNTIVPQFLSEMDGLTASHTIVMLASNRPDTLDPAVIRDGRINKRIKVRRPNEETAFDVLNIHLRDIPLHETNIDEVCARLMADIFSKSKVLYKVNGEYMFYLGHALSGSMLAGFVEEAKMFAIARDTSDSLTGITLDDFQASVVKLYESHQDVSHDYDLEDFAEEHGICGELSVIKMNSRHGDR